MTKEFLSIFLSTKSVKDINCLLTLHRWAGQFTPLVGLDREVVCALNTKDDSFLQNNNLHNGLILDLTGTERLFGKPADLSRRLVTGLRKANIQCRAALSPTIGCSWGLSRFSKKVLTMVNTAQLREAVSDLPTAALRISSQTDQALNQLGIYNVAALLKLPRRLLPERFGIELNTRLDQALGAITEVLHLAHLVNPPKVSKSFETPLCSRESINIATLSLLQRLLGEMATAGQRSSGFVIEFFGIGLANEPFAIKKEIALQSATSNRSHILGVISAVTEGIKIQGQVKTIKVAAFGVSKNSFEQADWLGQTLATDTIDELIDNLLARLGRDSVNLAYLHESYIPEKSFGYRSITSKDRTITKTSKLLGDRPPYLFNPPERANVIAILPDGPPAALTWHGQRYKIVTGLGPERISGEWWLDDSNLERDYFKIQDETGRWLWVFRDKESMNWFVHGLWT